ncbi:MAG TPA: hypothetical protein VH298_14235 [Jatrophihabitans sp.]|nr:hypothetical protein [Jatrophihabitans sp.]
MLIVMSITWMAWWPAEEAGCGLAATAGLTLEVSTNAVNPAATMRKVRFRRVMSDFSFYSTILGTKGRALFDLLEIEKRLTRAMQDQFPGSRDCCDCNLLQSQPAGGLVPVQKWREEEHLNSDAPVSRDARSRL